MGTKESIQSDEKIEIDEPKRYKVLLLNDDYTTMDFVIEVLINYFSHTIEEAVAIMMLIHEKGKGICGIYTHEIAETKAAQVKQEAIKKGFPLRAIIEEE